jgi:hypothetical protein
MQKKFSSLSVLLYRIITYPYPYRIGIYRLLMAKFPKYRPHYLACMFDAAKQAASLGYSTVSAIEFGVAGGNGLVAIEKYSELVLRKTGVRFKIYGFDMGNNVGLPKSHDPRDINYLWEPGDYKMDEAALRKKLNNSKLFLGDVATTISDFIKETHAPLALCFFDLDYYTSTVSALKIFDESSIETLPRVTCYFDDVDVASEFNGALGSITNFNLNNNDKKIFHMSGHYHEQQFGMLSNKVFHMHNFKHFQYNQYISGVTAKELPLVKS